MQIRIENEEGLEISGSSTYLLEDETVPKQGLPLLEERVKPWEPGVGNYDEMRRDLGAH